jgi:predicted transcriptional regulator
MKYRSRLTIASAILQLARVGNATKTRLMYGSFLSFAQINQYLNFLLANALIIKSEETHTYGLTEKGSHFLRIYDEMAELIPVEEKAPMVVGK